MKSDSPSQAPTTSTTPNSLPKLSVWACLRMSRWRNLWLILKTWAILANCTSDRANLRKSGQFSTPEAPILGFSPPRELKACPPNKRDSPSPPVSHQPSRKYSQSTGLELVSVAERSEATLSMIRYYLEARTVNRISLSFPNGLLVWLFLTRYSMENSMHLSAWLTPNSRRRMWRHSLMR